MSNHYDYRFADNANPSDSGAPGWVVGLIAGAAVGGGLALLFAPRQGTDTRQQLAARGQQAGRQLRQAYDSVAETTRRNARRLTEQAQDWRRSRSGDEWSAAKDAIPAGEHRSPDSSRVLGDMVGEATYQPAHVEPNDVGRGATAPAPSEPRSPFA
jgi:gas vesicle protein